ncbi:MAG TPA: NUDIX domain-containing protein [Actinomycetaceae bacterium]|nr:NUDIX domain-containing protein [Actinomycetaceae bacterium]
MSFAVIPAAYVYLWRDRDSGPQVLLQLRRNTGFRDGYWAAGAAGHVERDEPVTAAARRELREELGVEATDLRPLTAMHRTAGNGLAIDERVDFFFTCRRWDGEPRAMESAKSGGLRWVSLAEADDAAHPVVPHELAVLQAWAAGGPPPVMTWGFR